MNMVMKMKYMFKQEDHEAIKNSVRWASVMKFLPPWIMSSIVYAKSSVISLLRQFIALRLALGLCLVFIED